MSETTVTHFSGWGRYPRIAGRQRYGENLERITKGAVLSRGLGRSYGDASLPPAGDHVVAVTTRADRVLSFDRDTGVMRAEAGLSLADLNRLCWPLGWCPPSSPGTQSVTLGGMVAADVHGKSHHSEGCFGAHVLALRMRVADGRILDVSDDSEPELFRATLGGLGLTGHVMEVTFRLRPTPSPWIEAESERYDDLDALLDALEGASADWPHTVAWADLSSRGKSRGRGILDRGRAADPKDAPRSLPVPRRTFTVPVVCPALSELTIRSLNFARFWGRPQRRLGIAHPESFFYPLDVVGRFNRLYGRRGFTQYQAVLPARSGRTACVKVFDILDRMKATPLLCVLKDFRNEGKGMLSFPMQGLSLAIDLPIRDHTQAVVDAMNDYVAAEGGRVYLAKDALTRPEHFRAMEPRLDNWLRVRRIWDPDSVLKSALSVRLFGDAR
ncbi:MAG: FAD-binding oxidoreductase [Acidobacteria bacterium]|nr:FAD-binding oxidoreductase [Acidobacteriota bacterium]